MSSNSVTFNIVLQEARNIARRLGSSFADSRHVFIALYTVHRGTAYSILLKNGIRSENMQQLAGVIREQALLEVRATAVLLPELTDRTNELIEKARVEATKLGSESVGTAHMLIMILQDGNEDIMNCIKEKGFNPKNVVIEAYTKHCFTNSILKPINLKKYYIDYYNEFQSLMK